MTDPYIYLSDYHDPDYLIPTVELDVYLDPVATKITSTFVIRPNSKGAGKIPLLLNGDELELEMIALDNAILSNDAFTVTPKKLILTHPPETEFTLTLVTRINPSANTKLMGLYLSNGVYCTQCEPEGFRRITYSPDRPDVMSQYRVRIEAKKTACPVLLSNGNLCESGDVVGTERHYAIWKDPHPKPSYLFALVAGDMDALSDSYVTRSGETVALNIYASKGKTRRATYAMESLKSAMKWDEDAFGREYDLSVFNIVAIADFNMGAMENKGLNVFNDSCLLASPELATDEDYHRIESIVAHEYFHNWTGNRITCRDWFQLCLKEGLTVFRDQEFSSDLRSRSLERIRAARSIKSAQFVEDAGPLSHPVRPEKYKEINNFYTTTIYNKGAEIIRMLATLIGERHFREGMDLYFNRHDGQAVTIEDFLACFSEVSARDLTSFARWYSEAGTPRVTVTYEHDPEKGTLVINFSQEAPPQAKKKAPFVIPIRFGAINENGKILVEERVFILEHETARLTLEGVKETPFPAFFRAFSAPVIVNLPKRSAQTSLTLARHDPDAFTRYESIQSCFFDFLKRSVRALQKGEPPLADATYGETLSGFLKEKADPYLIAALIASPTYRDVAREIGADVDPDAVVTACDAFEKTCALACIDLGRQVYDQFSREDLHDVGLVSAGKRALRAAILMKIVAAAPEEGGALARALYFSSALMTDKLLALSALRKADSAYAGEVFAHFESAYADEPNVLDSWFSQQALFKDDAVIERIKTLTRHPKFSFLNPNRVRALIGVFALGNFPQFHRPDGEGYALLAEFVTMVDAANPQIAAKSVSAFRDYVFLEPSRKARIRETLVKLTKSDLSRDTRDIIERLLA